ncbi:hypothetical protein N0V87_004430 [Didymella glomerata]|uniref:Clr5 domain-containing protein n=1 Tax=Didymella glomerata TaxID=749621 RepID=A0A9W8X0G1_9PLEO|nr:hypothetical protein N0V87_004430 [Didymella glomerata]
MTKDWNAVQDEIKELSFNQKKPLEEVKELMERKTRAYRMKLKEWGLMRHKVRKTRPGRTRGTSSAQDDEQTRTPSAPSEPMAIDSDSLEHRTKTGGWQIVNNVELTNAEPTFMGMLSQTPNLQPSVEIPEWMQDPPTASDSLQDMLACILDNNSVKLEKILLEHVSEVNDPIGMPFELPSGRFANHPALSRMVIMQHPQQTLLDIAAGMPNGPVVWVLLTYGAKGSTHPLGTDLALHNAIKNGRHYTVQALLIPGRSDVNGLPDKRWRPLLQAVFWTGPEVVSILLKRGARVDDAVDPNALDGLGVTPLRKCIEQAASTDVLMMTQKLLDGGADPEYEDVDGVQPYAVAALTLQDPLRLEVLQLMLNKMQGHHTKIQEGRTYKWEPGLFPIPDKPTYNQVLACTKADDDFRLSMQEMVPIDVQPAFRRAYVAVITGRLLDNISQAAVANKISEKDRWDIMLTLSIRKGANLPDYQFDQALHDKAKLVHNDTDRRRKSREWFVPTGAS